MENPKVYIFDYDGVFTNNQILITEKGDQLRQSNVRDGFAIKKLIRKGFKVFLISGSKSEGVKIRLIDLGIPEENIYLGISNKLEILNLILMDIKESPENVLYMGDDIPDIQCLRKVGFPICPYDAVPEVKRLQKVYVTMNNGGEGCVREIISVYVDLTK